MLIDMTTQELLRVSAARAHAVNGTGRAIRKAAGVTMAEVAAVVGVSEPTVWRWEEGRHRPRGAAAARWADVLAELAAAAKTTA